ncbi:urease accessory UreF family protein [Actinocorallia sp. A-T 12471]|uniref:urease accessory protein UreF n=1 Tax=Actinocorallia sp. A-T 12471 TaxID=3089813 RepID=UPI0029CF1EC5|nr:urease accessory UreF family protein [Actinocorallia sp. A-T 12471]MDX6744693.1 urease accessory UreF family protein [Actinocorallia sp. A-T 12471]
MRAHLLMLADSRLPAGGHAHSGGLEPAVTAGAVRTVPDLADFLHGRLWTAGLVVAALAAAARTCAATTEHAASSGAGLGPTGSEPAGFEQAGAEHAGSEQARAEAAGPASAGPGRAGAERAGAERAGAERAGSERAGFARAGAERAGAERTEAESAGFARVGGGLAGWAELDAEADARTPSRAQRVASRAQGKSLLRAARATWPSPVLDGLRVPVGEGMPRAAHHPIVLGAAAHVIGCSALDAASVAAYGAVTGPASAAVRLLGLDPLAVQRALADLASEVDEVAEEAAAYAEKDWAELPAVSAPALDLWAEEHLRADLRLFES